ncbi:MAG TPA: sialidase family protein [Terriglobales bacterium]|nr:sialidase family protein [Terriglobales bacterium]
MRIVRVGVCTAWVVFSLGMRLDATPILGCGAALGTKFNLEPAANAVPQQLEAVDFIPNRVALHEDLVVGGAFDSRGVTFAPAGATTPHWDASVGGYYVRRSSTAGCAPQFEGGLPAVMAGGKAFTSNGGVAVAADPARDAFFVADLRFSASNAGWSGIGLFRASSATLLNTALCPKGTHTAAQAKSCWTATPPAMIDPIPSGGNFNVLDYPSIAVDERANGSGTGAGDVYLAFNGSDGQGGVVVNLVSCSDGLSCSAPRVISASGENVAFNGTQDAYVQVRPDGNVTVTYLDQTSPNENSPTEIIKFVICQPRGAPRAPVCSRPTVVATERQTISTSQLNQALSSENFFAFTNVRHAHRLEGDGKTVTTFVVWDRCAEYFTFLSNPNRNQPALCLNADVVMRTSTNGGQTWSATTAVNTDPGHQFFPSISTDDSTGIVNIVYYDTEQDFLHKRMVVALNQIAAGTTEVGAPLPLTTTPIPWDADPNQTALPVDDFDFHFGMKARGMGMPGFSRIYVSFTSTADREGIYNGQSLPEQNNNLQEVLY